MSGRDVDSELVERIVREVIRRLLAMGLPGEAELAAVDQNPESNTLVLSEPVVALATLAGRLDGVGRVVIGSRAVVTPAVRDQLKDHQIELVRN